jgi:hypothetical protein
VRAGPAIQNSPCRGDYLTVACSNLTHAEAVMNKLGRTPTTAATRFWLCVNKDGPVHPGLGTACWVWTSHTSKNGYGRFYNGQRPENGQRQMRAHRWSFEQAYGCRLKDDNDMVLHKCDNKLCVRPDHLFRGSQADNMRDRSNKGRQPRGITHPCVRLTEDQVHYIRTKKRRKGPETLKQLAARFGVTLSAIMHIRQGHSWKHLQTPEPAQPAELPNTGHTDGDSC